MIKRKAIHEAISFTDFTIVKYDHFPDSVFIYHEDGNGGKIDKKKFDNFIKEFFNENFLEEE